VSPIISNSFISFALHNALINSTQQICAPKGNDGHLTFSIVRYKMNNKKVLGGNMAVAVKISDAEAAPGAWVEGVESAEFRTLIDAKQRSIVPMVVIYIVGYMGLSVLAGFGRGILGMKVLGAVNLGFVLIAGNYAMSWALAIVYARISANRHDPLVKVVADKARASRRAL
jgi:uncharacterized membrane protein (DUF485 family)